jgi:hypothetical protein
LVDAKSVPELYARLKTIPAVAGSAARAQALKSFYETLAAQMLTFAFFNTILASTITSASSKIRCAFHW